MRKAIWLFLSSFGIMFAVLSWMQESGVISTEIGALKGVAALVTGTILYFTIPRFLELIRFVPSIWGINLTH